MNDTTISDNKPKFYCETRKCGCDYNSAYMKHI